MHDPTDSLSLSTDRILYVYADRAGSLWVSAQDGGVNRYDSQAKPFLNFSHDPQDIRSLSHRTVNAFFEDHAGNLLVGTRKGVDISAASPGQFTRLPFGDLNPQSERKNVLTILEDQPGRFWLGMSNGFARVEYKDGQKARTTFFPGATVLTILVDRAGLLWLGRHGGGLTRFDPATEQMANFVIDPSDPQSLSDNLVFIVYEDQAGALWVGTSNGLNRFDQATGKFTRFLHDPRDPQSLSYNLVWSIYEDRTGALWIGTGGGLNRFDRSTQRFTRYTEKDGLPNDNVMGIHEDAAGNLWLGTLNGISRLDPQTTTFRNYDLTDGLFGNEMGQGAHYQNRQGHLYFGGPEGFTVFNPDLIKDDTSPPPIVLTSCHRYNTDVTEGTALVEKGIGARDEIEFSYKDNILTFEFAALSFNHPEKNQYAYQLTGYSDQWIQLGTKREVTFTNLDPGKYTLRVRGSNNNGAWNTTGTSLRIVIVPPFWRRWWFMGLELAAVLGLAWMVYRWRIATLQRRNEQQQAFSRQLIESQEQERKRIAAGLHDSLGQQLLVIKNWAMIGITTMNGNTQPREPLDEISTTASEAIDEVREVIYDLRPYQLDKIGLANTIRFMVEKVAAASGIKFQTEIGEIDDLLPLESQVTLYRIVQECVNNIVKHSQATAALVAIKRQGHAMSLFVEDNGRGFALESAGNVRRGGFGLTGLRERVHMLGGWQTIHSTPGGGTKIQITIEVERRNED